MSLIIEQIDKLKQTKRTSKHFPQILARRLSVKREKEEGKRGAMVTS